MEINPAENQEAALQTIPVESFEQTVQRLRFATAEGELPESADEIYQIATRNEDGSYSWDAHLSQPAESPGLIKVEGNDETAKNVQAEALQATDNDTDVKEKIARYYRWWDRDVNGFKEDAETRLEEIFSLTDGERSVPLLNMSGEQFSEDELDEITKTFQTVVNFTGGKIFDRVKGIAFRKDDRFTDESAGSYWVTGRVASFNMEQSRKMEHGLNDRYLEYFEKGQQPSRVALIMAHELGHAMDIDIYKDNVAADASLLEKKSHFDDKFIWGMQDRVKNNQLEENWSETLDCIEPSPTGYAETDAREDFAETFALLSQGVDRNRLPQRAQAIADVIYDAGGSASHGPFLIRAEREQELKAKVPDNVYVNSYVQTEQAA